MSARVSFADLLKAGADKDKQRINLKLAPPAPPPLKAHAPEKDFNKRANSLDRDALPGGLFPGASKAIYDALYLRTLGAVNPTNTIQATRKQIINWSGVKNIKTVSVHLKKLEDNGLIKRSNFVGEQSGNHYEIYLPPPTNPTQPNPTHPIPDPNRKLDIDQTQKLGWVGLGKPVENKATYRFPNTSLKTFKETDDEPAARNPSREGTADAVQGAMEKVLNAISKKKTGKGLKADDDKTLNELAELLAMEFEIAAARTDSISNIPAFLTEHLRRRLLSKPENQIPNKTSGAKAVSKSLQVGKGMNSTQADAETYQAEPLTEPARETVLQTMREYIEKGQREFVINLRSTYTAQDWQWLSENLPAEKAKQ